MEKYGELKKMEVHNNEYRAEIKQVRVADPAVFVDWAVGWEVIGVNKKNVIQRPFDAHE